MVLIVAYTVTEDGLEPVETIRIISARRATSQERIPRRKGRDMPMVEYTLDTLPEMTEERRQELARLDALLADQIDTSDIPELTDEQWAGAVRGRFYRPIKQQITARLDADVLAWLKAGGQGYQTRMNAILRRAMMADLDRRA